MATYQSSSRYYNSTTTAGKSTVATATRTSPTSKRFSTYTSVEDDTFERIAFMAFSDSSRYWEIADINSHVPYPDFIPVGTRIRIPIV